MRLKLPAGWRTPRELLGEIPPEDIEAFKAHVEQRLPESARSVCQVLSLSLVLTWPFDLVLYRADPQMLGALAGWRTAELLVYGTTFLVLGRRSQGKNWAPTVLGLTSVCATLVCGVAMTRFGASGQPFSHSLPMAPFCTMVLFAPLRLRIVLVGLTMAIATASLGAICGPTSEFAQVTSTLLVAGLLAVAGGQILFDLQRQGFLQERAITRRTLELTAANAALEAKVGERTESLRLLTTHSADALEQERARIAADLHEELGQVLSAIRLEIEHAEHAAPSNGPLPEALERFSQILEATVVTSRRIASEAHPRILEDFGLLAALEMLIDDFRARHGCECELLLPRAIDTDSARSLALYRSVQECLTNIAKHARAEHVRVSLECTGDALRLEIGDDGCGLPGGRVRPGAMGLLGMRERAWQFGGKVHVSSQPGQGTTVLVELPLIKPPSGSLRAQVPAPLQAHETPGVDRGARPEGATP